MGVNTYELGGGCMRLRPECVDRAGAMLPEVAGAMALALSKVRQEHEAQLDEADGADAYGETLEGGLFPPSVAAELLAFGLDQHWNLTSERPPWVGVDQAHVLAAQTVAPWIAPGSWCNYETEGDAWAVVWTGETAVVVDMVPRAPAGLLLLDPSVPLVPATA